MPYRSLATIKGEIASAQKVVKKTTASYTNGSAIATVKGKQTAVVAKTTTSFTNSSSLSTVKAKAPVVGGSTSDYKGFVTAPKPLAKSGDATKIVIPTVVGVTYTNGSDVTKTGEQSITGGLVIKVKVSNAKYKFHSDQVLTWTF